MTRDHDALLELINQNKSEDFLKIVLEKALDCLMNAEVSSRVQAGYQERTESRETYRNGYRERSLNTGVGTLDLKIPKIRKGVYFPGFLDRFHRTESALVSVIQEAYVAGVSTRRMEKIIQEMGIESLSKSQVSDVCQTIKDDVDSFLQMPLEGSWPYVYLDATYIKVRSERRIVSKAAIIAIGINDQGERRILGLQITDSEACIFWKQFLESLQKRGLKGVQLVISDAHAGLKEALQTTLLGASWQRCWVHFMRNILSHTSKKTAPLVLPHLKAVMMFKTPKERRETWDKAITELAENHPKVAAMMEEATEAVLAHTHFPVEHWTKIYTNNPIERLNREIKRRTNCVGIFPNDNAAIRLIGAILIQQDENWIDSKAFLKPQSFKNIIQENER